MRVILIDDEPAALERLVALMAQIPDLTIVATAPDGPTALAAIAEHRPDLVLLDVQMPELNGLIVASRIPADQRPEIIFVTAFEMYAPDAFEVDAADYLLKPVRFDRLRQAVERARRRQMMRAQLTLVTEADPADADSIWVQTRQGHVRVMVRDVDWIEAAKDYVLLHTPTRSHMHRVTMTALQTQLDPERLIRVHRSAFVAPDRVKEVRRTGRGLATLVLADGVMVQVGPTYLPSVMIRLGLHDAD